MAFKIHWRSLPTATTALLVQSGHHRNNCYSLEVQNMRQREAGVKYCKPGDNMQIESECAPSTGETWDLLFALVSGNQSYPSIHPAQMLRCHHVTSPLQAPSCSASLHCSGAPLTTKLLTGQVVINIDLLLPKVFATPEKRLLVICSAELQTPKDACRAACMYGLESRSEERQKCCLPHMDNCM